MLAQEQTFHRGTGGKMTSRESRLKLTLNRETVRELNEESLRQAAGGASVSPINTLTHGWGLCRTADCAPPSRIDCF
jgi:hypothetical protein